MDVLKGICIIFVIVTHSTWGDDERLKLLFPFWIDMAVPVFMMISGYVYALSYKRRKINDVWKAYSFGNVLGKIIRYTVPFAIYYVIEIIFYMELNVFGIVRNFLTGGYGPGSYYYPLMIQFVFLYPLVYFVVERYREKGVVIIGAINIVYEILQLAYGISDGVYRLLVLRYLLLIAAGCFVGLYGHWTRKKIPVLLLWLAGLLFIIFYKYFGYEPKIIIHWTGTSCVAALYVIPPVMWLLANHGGITCPPIEFLGKASYHIFLFQILWYKIFEKMLMGALGISMGQWELLLLNIAVCIVCGVVFYCAESPLSKVITRFLLRGQMNMRQLSP